MKKIRRTVKTDTVAGMRKVERLVDFGWWITGGGPDFVTMAKRDTSKEARIS